MVTGAQMNTVRIYPPEYFEISKRKMVNEGGNISNIHFIAMTLASIEFLHDQARRQGYTAYTLWRSPGSKGGPRGYQGGPSGGSFRPG